MSSPEAAPEMKQKVRDFWDQAACGEIYARGQTLREMLAAQADARDRLEPYIRDFARFRDGTGRDVLEIGVGMGADHLDWARVAPRSLTGLDLTPRAVQYTKARLEAYERQSRLLVGDAEQLPFADASFDLVYSWGVLHHSPDTAAAVGEVARVLRPGGMARVMIYHRQSLVGYMLWARYALMAGRPGRSLDEIYAQHLESPGTKACSVDEALRLFAGFSRVEAKPKLSFGDLLEGEVGQRHRGVLLWLAKRLWPRRLIEAWFPKHGLYLLVEAVK